MANHTQLSKFLALILRHKADKFNLKLDEQGFVDVQDVWKIIENRFGDTFQYDDLLLVVAGDKHGKKRYEIVDGKIRAMFGHSNVREIQYPIVTPPQNLYHGTSKDAIKSIRKFGLQAQSRQYVHLTTNLANAKRVAYRHSKHTIILQIDALTAHHDGVVFHQPETEHFLCQHIPAEYIDFDNITDSIE
jgi:putative RNA 2'-phosphotransferase